MPQNLKTEPVEDMADLPDLTDKQRRFVQARLAGKSGADAVRAATDTQEWSQESIWAEATKLNNNPSVRLWLAAGRKACLGSANITLQSHLDELDRLKQIALESGNVGAAVLAEHHRGKAAGHYVEQVRDMTEHDPQRTIMEIAQHSPELARELAKQYNIPFPQTPAEQGERVH